MTGVCGGGHLSRDCRAAHSWGAIIAWMTRADLSGGEGAFLQGLMSHSRTKAPYHLRVLR